MIVLQSKKKALWAILSFKKRIENKLKVSTGLERLKTTTRTSLSIFRPIDLANIHCFQLSTVQSP